MKNIRIILIFICIPFLLFAQDNVIYNIIQEAKLSNKDFSKLNFTFVDNKDTKQDIDAEFLISEDVYYMKYDNLTSKKLDNAISLLLSFNNDSMELELLDFSNTINNYYVVTSDGMRIPANKNIRHYRGIVKNKINSFAALTFLNDEVIGLITTEKGNFNISFDQRSGNHILFRDKNLKKKIDFRCNTIDDYSFDYEPEILSEGIKSVNNLNSKSVSFYFETENDIFQIRGSVASVEGFVAGIYNQVAVLYQNEGIQTNISEIFIWTTQDPYTATNSAGLLTQFQNERTSINANLGHLLTFRSIGGGQAAGFQGLCSTNTTQKLAVSMLFNNYQSVPIYSWSVFVIAHEFGHLFGSRHTHACVWNGNNTAIDGCAGTMEGSCPNPGNPSEGGTIMSYCHLQDVGVNFSLGFGPQPRNVIQNNVFNCVASISGPSEICDQATFTINNFPQGATVSWSSSNTTKLALTSGQGTSTANFNKINNGKCNVNAIISIGGNNISLTKAVSVGVPDRPWISNSEITSTFSSVDYTLCIGQGTTSLQLFFIQSINSAEATSWEVTKTLNPSNFSIVNNGDNIFVIPNQTGTGQFTVKAVNSCGVSTVTTVNLTINTCDGGRGGIDPPGWPIDFSMYSNPASGMVTIEVFEQVSDSIQNVTRSESYQNEYTIQLRDAQGVFLRNITKKHPKAQISLQGIPSGMYYVHLIVDNQIIQKKTLWVK